MTTFALPTAVAEALDDPTRAATGPSCMAGAAPLHEKHLGVCRCKCVFVDIGMNDGKSLMKWWRHPALSSLPDAHYQRLRACAESSGIQPEGTPSTEHCFYGIEADPGWR
eukprot:6701583-Prymnesium_polylepis.1